MELILISIIRSHKHLYFQFHPLVTYQILTTRMTVGIDSANCNMRQSSIQRAIRGSSIIPKGYDMLYRMPSSMRFFFVMNSVTVQENCNKLYINSDHICPQMHCSLTPKTHVSSLPLKQHQMQKALVLAVSCLK